MGMGQRVSHHVKTNWNFDVHMAGSAWQIPGVGPTGLVQ